MKLNVFSLALVSLSIVTPSVAQAQVATAIILRHAGDESQAQRELRLHGGFTATKTCLGLRHLDGDRFICAKQESDNIYRCHVTPRNVYFVRCTNGRYTLKYNLSKIGPELKSQFKTLKRPVQ